MLLLLFATYVAGVVTIPVALLVVAFLDLRAARRARERPAADDEGEW